MIIQYIDTIAHIRRATFSENFLIFRLQLLKFHFGFWTPDASRTGSYKIGLVINYYYYCLFFSKTALTIFLIFCTVLEVDKGKKVTEPDFPKKIPIRQKLRKCGQNGGFLRFSRKRL